MSVFKYVCRLDSFKCLYFYMGDLNSRGSVEREAREEFGNTVSSIQYDVDADEWCVVVRQ